jgi:putative CocE/NonD family hydrolase
MIATQLVRPLAERGYQVLVQSTRGTFGSDGPFDPLRREREDGLDTLDWVIEQPWFGEQPPDRAPVRLAIGAKAGRVDNTKLETRADVLTYTTPVLDHDVEVIGEVSAEVWFRSSLAHADVFVRLCDVDGKGRSTNICDGLISLTNATETTCATVRLWPTAYRFKRGHRIRVQVSSGAFPRYNRNPGTGEPRATATTLRAADQQVFHDPEHPSAVILPIRKVT